MNSSDSLLTRGAEADDSERFDWSWPIVCFAESCWAWASLVLRKETFYGRLGRGLESAAIEWTTGTWRWRVKGVWLALMIAYDLSGAKMAVVFKCSLARDPIGLNVFAKTTGNDFYQTEKFVIWLDLTRFVFCVCECGAWWWTPSHHYSEEIPSGDSSASRLLTATRQEIFLNGFLFVSIKIFHRGGHIRFLIYFRLFLSFFIWGGIWKNICFLYIL